MARLAPPDRETLPEGLREFMADVPQHAAFDMLAHSAGTVRPFLEQGIAQYTELELPARSRELVIMTTAVLARSRYELVQHIPISRAAGVEQAVADAIAGERFDDSALSAYDRAVVGFVALVVRQPTLPDNAFAELREHLSDREILEVLQVTGFYWSFGRVCTVLEIEIEDDHGTAVVEASQLLQERAT